MHRSGDANSHGVRHADGEVALFAVGSDGLYPVWWGIDADDEVACLVIPLGGAYERPR